MNVSAYKYALSVLADAYVPTYVCMYVYGISINVSIGNMYREDMRGVLIYINE